MDFSKNRLIVLNGFVLFLLFGQSCSLMETEFITPVPELENISQVEYNSFTAKWTAPLGVDNFIVEVATDENFGLLLPDFPIQVSTTSKLIDGLEDGKTYFIRVRAIFQGQNTDYSNSIEVTTSSFEGNYPTDLTLTSTTPTQVTFTWQEATDASGYIINLAQDPDFTNPVSNYFQKDVGNITTITISDLDPSTTYYFQLRSYISVNGMISSRSDYTPTQEITTEALPAPTMQEATDVTPLRFTANWDAVAEADFYLLDIATDADFNNILADYNEKPWFETSISLEDLDYRSNYYYRVKAKRQDHVSEYSETVTVNSAIPTGSNGCRIKKIWFNSSEPTTFSYDDLGRIDVMFIRDRYIKNRQSYKFYYDGDTDKIIRIDRFYNNGNLADNIDFFYLDADDLVDSLSVNNPRNSNVTEHKYTYNSDGQLINYWRMYNGNKLQEDRDLFYDDNGNVIKIKGKKRLDGTLKNTNWEMTYDEKINPFVLLPQEIAFLIPFTLDYNRTIPPLPFLPTRNITFMDFKASQEVASYGYNASEIAIEQKGFFEISYVLENCD